MLRRYLPYCLLGLALGWAGPTLAEVGQVHEFKLDNGLKLLVKPDRRAPVVVSQVWYKVGGSYEPEGKTGLSHVLEHMMFKGTERYPAGEFSRIMAANGAQDNAFTGMDYTAYFQRLEKGRLEVSFELEADRMRHLKLLEEEFHKERQVVIEERRMRTEDKPNALVYEQFMAAAFQTSPYRHPIIGWMSDLDSMNLADLADWYRQWYAPNNATLVVVGDVEPQAVLALAQKHFAPLVASPPTALTPRPETEQLGIKRITVKRPAELPYLLMGYKVPGLKQLQQDSAAEDWEAYALDLLATLLDGDDSSRLSKHLLRGQEVASSVSAGYDLYSRLDDLFTFSGIPSQNHSVAELEHALREQIQALQDSPVSPEELRRVKTQLRAAKIYEQDSVFYQAMQIGVLETVGLDYRLQEEYLARIDAVTPAQVQAVARKYLVDDRLTVAVLEPLPLDPNAPKSTPATDPHGAY